MSRRWWLRLVLRLFPEAFRQAHYAEIDDWVDEALHGASGLTFLAAGRIVADLVAAAIRLRIRPVRTRSRGASGLAVLATDLRQVVRGLVLRPAYSVVVLATLALGVGLNVALFSVVNAAILRPLDYEDPDRLVYLTASLPGQEIAESYFSGGDLEDLRGVGAFEAVEGLAIIRQNLHGAGVLRQVTVGWASGGFLDLFGREALLGRLHRPDDPPGQVVLTARLWRTAFGAEPDVVGSSIQLDGHPFTIVGVMADGFVAHLPGDELEAAGVELWKNPDPFWQNGDVWAARGPEFPLLQIVARLRPDALLADGQAGVDRVAASLSQLYPVFAENGYAITLEGLHDRVIQKARPILLLLLSAVGVVLLMACANVVNLGLVRGLSRRRELALRVALGSSSRRIAGLVLSESTILAISGTIAGLVLAWFALSAVDTLAPPGLALIGEVSLDWAVLGFAAALTLLVATLTGLLPAWSATRGNSARLIGSARVVGGAAGLRRALVVAQIAGSLVLLVGAGLLVSSISRLQRIDPGFDPTDVYTFAVTIPGAQYGWPVEAGQFYRSVEATVAELPEVDAAGVVWPMPFSATWTGGHSVTEGTPRDFGQAEYRLATEAYFPTMAIPLHDGRLFGADDVRHLVVVSERVAERVWPGASPIGRMIEASPFGGAMESFEVIGVVADVRYENLQEPSPGTLYFDARSWSWVDWEVHVLVRSSVAAETLLPRLREAVAGLDSNVPITRPAPLADAYRLQTAETEFVLVLFGVFAAAAGLLALVGLYGLVSYGVGLRRREFGVRLALGSARTGIRRIILREGARLVVAGLLLGLIGAIAASTTLEALLFEVSPTDARTYASVASLLAVAALAASWIPAWRMGRVDPAEVLRDD